MPEHQRCELCRYGEDSGGDIECRWAPKQIVPCFERKDPGFPTGSYMQVAPLFKKDEWCHQWARKFSYEEEVED